jgi:CHAD domain-containing protein
MRELSFEGSKRFRFRSFLTLAAQQSLQVRTVRIERIHTTDFDTGDRRLEAIGASVRYRASEGWTLGAPAERRGHGAERLAERRFAGSPEEPPPELVAILAGVLCGAPLVPIGESRALLHRARIFGRNRNDALAIAALDVRPVRDGKGERAERRLVLELLDPANAELFADTARLLEEAGARGADPPARERLLKEVTAAEAVTRRLSEAFDRFCSAEIRLRILQDAESVHAARIELRRMRACVRVFSAVFAPEWSHALLERIGSLAKVYGRARDADVVVTRLVAASKKLAPDERTGSGEVLAPMLEARLRARRELTAFMNSEEYREIVAQTRAAVTQPQFRLRAARPARKLVGKLVARSWSRLERDVRTLGEHPEDAALHNVRIRAKRCRYAAEAQFPISGKRTHRFARRLGALQDELGRIQDAALERRWLVAFVHDAQTATVASSLEAIVCADAEDARRDWPLAWKAARRARRGL